MANGKTTRRKQQRPPAVHSMPWQKLAHWTLALVVFGAIGVGTFWLVDRLQDPRVLPFEVVRIDGQFRHLDRSRIEQAVGREIRGNFFTLDVERVRRAALALPWVDTASVRRVWPQTLVMQIEEQVPLARWGSERLVNARGVVFAPEDKLLPQGLTTLEGPATAAREVVAQYLSLKPKMALLGLAIERLQLDERGAWQLGLDDGLQLQLGSSEIQHRVARFLAYYPRVRQQRGAAHRLVEVDLRYTNGFTVRWREDPLENANEQKRTEIGMQSARRKGRV